MRRAILFIVGIPILSAVGFFGLLAVMALRDRAAAPSTFYYSTCDEARAHGAMDIEADDKGYRPELDKDGDGTACESYDYTEEPYDDTEVWDDSQLF